MLIERLKSFFDDDTTLNQREIIIDRAIDHIEALRAENEQQAYRIQMLEAALRNIYEEARCADVWGGAARAAMGESDE